MNKENIAKVIEAIKVDGQSRFNMSTFIGKVINPSFKKGDDLVYTQPTSGLKLNQITTTDLFNCDSVGCIAGFATAVSNDWKNPFTHITDDDESKYHVSFYFEQEANRFLGLQEQEGLNLYYGDGASIWKYLLYMEDNRFPELELEDFSSFDEYDSHWDSDEISINLRSITPGYAITLLQMLIDDEISLYGEDFEPEYLFEKEMTAEVLVDEDVLEGIMSGFTITNKEG